MPFRVNAQGVDHATGKTVAGGVSANDLPNSDKADMEELEDEEAVELDGRSVLLDEELYNGLAASINFQYKYEFVQTILLAMILGCLLAYCIFDQFSR